MSFSLTTKEARFTTYQEATGCLAAWQTFLGAHKLAILTVTGHGVSCESKTQRAALEQLDTVEHAFECFDEYDCGYYANHWTLTLCDKNTAAITIVVTDQHDGTKPSTWFIRVTTQEPASRDL